MRTFHDNDGREWIISLNVAAVKRIRDLAKIDVFSGGIQKFLEDVSANPVILVDALYAALLPQAEKRGISGEAFAESIAGDVIEAASDAFLEELVDFFPSARRKILKRILNASREAESEMNRRLAAYVESPGFRESLNAELESVFPSASASPESAE